MGKNVMLTAIHEEAMEVIERMKQHDGSELLINQNFNIAIFNILWRIAVNQRFPVSILLRRNIKHDGVASYILQHAQHDDPFINKQIKELQELFLISPRIAFFPWMRFIAPKAIGLERVQKFIDT